MQNHADHKLNNQISNPTIRIIGIEEAGLYSRDKALDIARKRDADLIEVSIQANVSICRIMEYSKFLYELKLQEKANKKSQTKSDIKEIKFGPMISDHDLGVKIKHAKEFLEKGNRVKATVEFRKGGLKLKDLGETVMLKFIDALSEVGKVDKMPELDGRKMISNIFPKK